MNVLESHFTSDVVQNDSILAFRIDFWGGIHELESVMSSSRSVGDIFDEVECIPCLNRSLEARKIR